MFYAGITAVLAVVPSAASVPANKAINITDIGGFLWPASDSVQIFFFCLILVSSVGVLIWAARTANLNHWKQRWKESQGDYKSPQELSDAVATPAERVCDALPGILLIVGLLGTFIGLGVALNNAAGVFDLKGEDQIEQLSAVVHSLGTKFKVSTWGIIGYLLVRSVVAWAGWNDRRLMWSVGQMRLDAGNLRQKQSDTENRVVSEISTGSRGISTATEKLGEALRPQLDAIKQNTHLTQASLTRFVDTQVESMERIAGSAKDMGEAANQMSSAANQVGVTAADLQDVVELLQDKLVNAIGLMNDSFNDNLEKMSNKIEKSTGDVSTAMSDLGENVGATMKRVEAVISAVSESFENTAMEQAKTIEEFNLTSETLSQNAEKMHKPIQELNTRLTGQLKTMASIGTVIAEFGQSNVDMAKVNDDIRTFVRGLSDSTDLSEICKTSDVERLKEEIAKGNDLLAELLQLVRSGMVALDEVDPANGTAA